MCKHAADSNENIHEQNHVKKTKYMVSVTGMGFYTFTFNVNLIDESESASINLKSWGLAVTRSDMTLATE